MGHEDPFHNYDIDIEIILNYLVTVSNYVVQWVKCSHSNIMALDYYLENTFSAEKSVRKVVKFNYNKETLIIVQLHNIFAKSVVSLQMIRKVIIKCDDVMEYIQMFSEHTFYI